MSRTQQVMELISCDLCGKETAPDETTSFEFGVDGSVFEVDTCAKHASIITKAVETLVAKARPAGRYNRVTKAAALKRPRSTSRPSRSRSSQSAVREWARAHGYDVGDRGRIPANVVAEYEASAA